MKDVTVAPRYARALYLVTERRGETAAALPDLQAIRDVLAPGTPVGRFFASPEVRLTDKQAALKRAFDGRALRTVWVFVDLLLRKKRLALLPEVTLEFEALVERSQGIQRAHVVSAVPLVPAELQRLQQELEQVTKSTLRISTEVDPSLIGGALVRIGDRVIDRSVRTLIERLSHRLQETSV